MARYFSLSYGSICLTLGKALRPIWDLRCPCWDLLGPFWAHCGPLWCTFWPIWTNVLSHMGPTKMGTFVAHCGPIWFPLVSILCPHGPRCSHMGPILEHPFMGANEREAHSHALRSCTTSGLSRSRTTSTREPRSSKSCKCSGSKSSMRTSSGPGRTNFCPSVSGDDCSKLFPSDQRR